MKSPDVKPLCTEQQNSKLLHSKFQRRRLNQVPEPRWLLTGVGEASITKPGNFVTVMKVSETLVLRFGFITVVLQVLSFKVFRALSTNVLFEA